MAVVVFVLICLVLLGLIAYAAVAPPGTPAPKPALGGPDFGLSRKQRLQKSHLEAAVQAEDAAIQRARELL